MGSSIYRSDWYLVYQEDLCDFAGLLCRTLCHWSLDALEDYD